MTPEDTISQCLQTMKAIRDTIETALMHRHITCYAKCHEFQGKRCKVVGVHVDVYTGVALKLVCLEVESTAICSTLNAQWVQARDCQLPPQPWEPDLDAYYENFMRGSRT